MRKMFFFQRLSAAHVERIRKEAPDWEIVHGQEPETWTDHLAEAEIWGGWRTEAEELLLSGRAKPRWIHLWTAGANRLPLEKLRAMEITVTNSSGVHAYPISETVLAMMLSWTRRVHIHIRRQKEARWIKDPEPLPEMHEKTLGVIGVGAIGSEIARLAQAFRMTVLGVRRSGRDDPHVDRMYRYDELEQMLPLCDYVVNTLPLTTETAGMFGEKEFKAMKKNAFFVNIGRGGTVDKEALVRALEQGWIGGAGLDVFDPEPLPDGHPLWTMDQVLITPHISGSTEHYTDRVIDIFIPNLRRYVQGLKPDLNVVNLWAGY